MFLDEFIIRVFVCVEENLEEILEGRKLRKRGFAPALKDSEVITMLVVGEFSGQHKDKEIWEFFRQHYQEWFPCLGSRTTFVTRCANLWQVFEGMQQHIAAKLGAFEDDLHIIDGLPLPVCAFARANRSTACEGDVAYGFCAAKNERFYGFRGHLLINSAGCITRFSLTAANLDERDAAYDITAGLHGWLLADKGYIRPTLTADLAKQGLHLITPMRSNMPEKRHKSLLNQMKNTRRLVETVIGQLAERFAFEAIRARDVWHYYARLSRKLLAHTLCFFIAGSLKFENILKV